MTKAEFTAHYEANFRRVYNYISYRVNNRCDVEDLVSQVFIRMLDKHHTYDPRLGSAEMWIISIARNAVTDYYRDRAKRQHADIDTVVAALPSGETLPEQLIIKHEDHRRLIDALSCLDERERQVVALRYGAELTNLQIARHMNLTGTNVGVILFRSLRKLRKILSKEVRL